MLRVTATGAPWRNWAQSVTCHPRVILRPEGTEAIAEAVRAVAAEGGPLRLAGSGHSFTPLVATDGTILCLDRWQGVEAIDTEARTATVRAGTKLKALGEMLHEKGLAQENLGDINVQSIAGAVSTGTHGTGARLRSIANQILELTLVTADGTVVTCSESENREVFKAAQVSLGALGVIARVKLGLMESYKLKLVKGKAHLDDVLVSLEGLKADNRHFEFFWFPHTDQVATKYLNPTTEPVTEGGVMKYFNDVVLENGGFGAISEVCRIVPRMSKAMSRLAASAVSEGVEVNYSHRLFATPRFVKFQEMEYNVPADQAVAVIREIRECLREHDFCVHFPIEVRFVQRDDIFLSPAHGRDACYIAVHMYKGMEYRPYFDAVEAIFRRYGGRPHWGKMHSLKAPELAALYPEWERFQAVRRELDPNGVFLSPYLRGLFEG